MVAGRFRFKLCAPSCCADSSMANEATLENLWRGGRHGYLCPAEQMKAWALREALVHVGVPAWGMHATIASKVKKIGGGHPSPNAIRELLEKIDADGNWYPGKSTQTSFGPKPALTPAKRKAICKSAMAMKDRGVEPTYGLVVAACPTATLNPETQRPVDKKRVPRLTLIM